MNIEMGKVYWQLDDTTSTYDTLKTTLESFGLVAIRQKPLGSEISFKRVTDWQTPSGVLFSTIWYKNLCHIRIGEWGGDFAEVMFDRICGSFGPIYEHDTIDFMYKGTPMFRLAIKRT